MRQVTIKAVHASDLDVYLKDLVHVFRDVVNSGSPLGFMPPISAIQARDYWLSLKPELEAGSRILLVALNGDAVVGSGQLGLSQRANSPHRAEINRLFVCRAVRGQGIGKSLMEALHNEARRCRRSLILLNTRHAEPAEDFYKSLGYTQVGVIPGWTIGPAGEKYDHVEMWKQLEI
jgi:acetyltransferase